jgi:hypothetical protein
LNPDSSSKHSKLLILPRSKSKALHFYANRLPICHKQNKYNSNILLKTKNPYPKSRKQKIPISMFFNKPTKRNARDLNFTRQNIELGRNTKRNSVKVIRS